MSDTISHVYCPSCGHELPAGAGFCSDCGHGLTGRVPAVPATRPCRDCGADLPAGAEFCRACGAAQAVAAPAPLVAEVAEEPAPSPAPMTQFCRDCGADLPAGAEFCRACGAEQAVEEPAAAPVTGGWSLFAPPPADPAPSEPSTVADGPPPEAASFEPSTMADGPPPEAASFEPSTMADGPPPEAPTAVEAPPTARPPDGSPSGEGSRPGSRKILVGSLVTLLLLGGGAAAYLTLGGKDDKGKTTASAGKSNAVHAASTAAPAATSASEPTATPTATPTLTPRPTATPDSGIVPEGSPDQFTGDIKTLLLDFHQAIVRHDYRAAWNLLSARKQAKEMRVDGYAKWRAAQASLAPYLDPSGLEVTVRDLDRKTGVALVAVSGMKWSAPHARCSEWSGFTWVKYEDGQWRYDPGFSTTPQRQRQWKDRYRQLLGASC